MPPALRGTYAGLACPPVVEYLAGLGVTAVELLPVHQFVTSVHLAARGLTDYWGYNTIGFFAPHDGYSAAVRAGRGGGQIAEFQAMVQALHAAGLEVLLDVVFNHTAEGSHLGPTLCFRGLDNPAYYRLVPDDPRRYVDTTGTGNSVNADNPTCLAPDHGLAAVLGQRDARRRLPFRSRHHARPGAGQLSTGWPRSSTSSRRTRSSPGSSSSPSRGTSARRTATAWAGSRSCGASGTAATATPSATSGAAATGCWPTSPPGIAGSSDLYGATRHRPTASINFITAHDGFTLRDLVSYEPQAQRGQRRGQPGRNRRQPVVELRRRRPGRRPGDPRAARPPVARAARHAAAVPRGADDPRRRRTRPHPGRQQQRLLPGQSDVLV